MRTNNKRVGIGLIAIFGVAVSSGLMAEHSPPIVDRVPSNERPTKKPIQKEPLTVPKRPPVVAIIDTGSDLTHPDLQGHEWINTAEIPDNGIDDDHNGYIDDIQGYDFVARTPKVQDSHGHGTHIAGIVAKTAPTAKIMNLKYFNRGLSGAEALRASLEAMRYAIRMKADVINYSGGGTIPSQDELRVLAEASRQGILVIAAAGNEAMNSERQPFYPANYNLPNILSVTAIDETETGDVILPTSNFGTRSVAVAAQGKDVESTLPGGLYGRMTGTSQATAVVTGAAARILAKEPGIPPEDLIERIVTSSRVSLALQGKTRLGSKLSADRALLVRNAKTERTGFAQALRAKLETSASYQVRMPAYGSSF